MYHADAGERVAVQRWVSSCGLVGSDAPISWRLPILVMVHSPAYAAWPVFECHLSNATQGLETVPQSEVPDLGQRMRAALAAELQLAEQVRAHGSDALVARDLSSHHSWASYQPE